MQRLGSAPSRSRLGAAAAELFSREKCLLQARIDLGRMFLLYNLLLALASVVLIPYYLLRGLRRGKYLGSLRERLGHLPSHLQQTRGSSIWLHAVSVGEVLSCQELVAALRTRFPAVKILVSTTTATGQKMAREKFSGLVDGVFYAPLEWPFAVRRTLRHVRPRLLVVAETEIWPNLFHEAKRFGAGLLLVNARMSDRSAPRYRRFRFFLRHVLALPDAILAQSPLDRQRLLDAGAPAERVHVGGNLKFDVGAAHTKAPAEIAALLERLKPRAVILAGSTREKEESYVLDAFRQISEKHDDCLLILAPRHPERFDAVSELLAASRVSFVRRSQLGHADAARQPRVLLLDSLGELASLYRLSDVVFIGGSLVNWGGHNLLEPAFASRPIVVGPYMQNFRAVADAMLAGKAVVQVQNPQELGPAIERLLENHAEAAALGERARCVAESHRGATERAAGRAGQIYHEGVPNYPAGTLARALLWLPARAWESAVRLRNLACDHGWLTSRRLEAFTVSVGNLTAGGTGKTPMVLWLIGQLQARGLSCAVLTRGYRRKSAEKMTVIEPALWGGPPGPQPAPWPVWGSASAEQTGDEAQIILRRFPVPMGIAADRYAAGKRIELRFHPDVFVLDDGFQHRRLARDLDLVLVDVTAPFGGRELLPLGRLREPLASLARASVIVLTRTKPWETWEGLQSELRRYNSDAPIFFARTEPEALVEATTGEEKPLAWLIARPSLAFCGVANPDAFWESLERIGVPLLERISFPDHHRYSRSDAQRLTDVALRSGADALVTTEKDLVNLPHLLSALYWLKTRLIVDRPEELLDLVCRGAARPASTALCQ